MKVAQLQALFAFFREIEPIAVSFLAYLETKDEKKKEEIADLLIKLIKKHEIELPVPEFVLKWIMLEIIARLSAAITARSARR